MASSNNPAKVLVGHAGGSPAYWYRGVLWDVLMSADETAGEFTFMEQIIPAHAGPPAHIHERQSEGFYLLSGEVEFVVGADDEVVQAEPGFAVWVPKGTRHAFRVTSDEDARVLNFYTPGGFDDHLPYYGAEATAQTLPPPDLGVSTLDRERLGTSEERRAAYLQRLADIAEGTWDFSMPDPNLPHE